VVALQSGERPQSLDEATDTSLYAIRKKDGKTEYDFEPQQEELPKFVISACGIFTLLVRAEAHAQGNQSLILDKRRLHQKDCRRLEKY